MSTKPPGQNTLFRRVRDNITSVTALCVVGLAIISHAFGLAPVWMVLALGLLVVVPLVGLLFGDEEWRKWDPFSDEFWDDIFGEDDVVEEQSEVSQVEPNPEQALQTLRERYARGELTDQQFDRKLERLLETERLEDVEELFERERE